MELVAEGILFGFTLACVLVNPLPVRPGSFSFPI